MLREDMSTVKHKEISLPERLKPTLQLYQKVLDQLNLEGSRLHQVDRTGGRIRLYQLGQQIGCGRYSKVKRSIHILTKEEVAIKIIDRDQIKDGDGEKVTHQEIHCLENICHPNVIRLFEVIETLPRTYLVLELVAGGDLLRYVKRKGKLEENEARAIYSQLLTAIIYLHEKFMAHRDIKPENVLRSDKGVIKLCDFGFSSHLTTSDVLITDFCGSMPYAAPELFYDPVTGPVPFDPFKTDLWSLGVLLVFMITSNQPFEAETTGKMKQLIQTVSIKLPAFISNECTDLISRILRLNPKQRLPAQQQLVHLWLCQSKHRRKQTVKHWLQIDKDCKADESNPGGSVYTAAEGIRRQLSFRLKETRHRDCPEQSSCDSADSSHVNQEHRCASLSSVCAIS